MSVGKLELGVVYARLRGGDAGVGDRELRLRRGRVCFRRRTFTLVLIY